MWETLSRHFFIDFLMSHHMMDLKPIPRRGFYLNFMINKNPLVVPFQGHDYGSWKERIFGYPHMKFLFWGKRILRNIIVYEWDIFGSFNVPFNLHEMTWLEWVMISLYLLIFWYIFLYVKEWFCNIFWSTLYFPLLAHTKPFTSLSTLCTHPLLV